MRGHQTLLPEPPKGAGRKLVGLAECYAFIFSNIGLNYRIPERRKPL